MTITAEDAEVLLNLRPGEMRISNVPAEAHGCDEGHLADNLLALRNELLAKSGVMMGNRPWRDSLIDSAFRFKELDLLQFFSRLMTEENGPEVLRVVFLHAQNHGIAPEDITSDVVDAYRLVTASGYREFNVNVTGTSRDNSDFLIKTIVTDPVSARKIISFITERGHNNPEALIDFLEVSKSTPTPLTPGSL
jgi:hypothetical protein